MDWLRAATFAALFYIVALTAAQAQDVTLTSPDGAVEITGTLLGFDGEFYRVDTRYGELTVDGSGVLCDGPGCPNLASFVAELAFSGSASMADGLIPALIEGFALRNGYQAARAAISPSRFEYTLRHSDTRETLALFQIRITNTDEGFADLLANEADVVLALREIRPDERKRAYDAGLGEMTNANRSRVLALDGLAAVVARSNRVTDLSMPQLAAVISGQVANWAELGGPDAPIALHLPADGSGLAQAIEDRILQPEGRTVSDQTQRHANLINLARAVETDPFAIGVTSFAQIGTGRVLSLTGPCGSALVPGRRSIKTEDYPLTAPMFLYLPARRLPAIAREFLAYTRSPAAQIVIRRAGYVDQAPELIRLNAQGERLANAIRAAGPEVSIADLQRLVSVMAPMARLTTSFRFEAGSARPDAQSRANIDQLARALEIGTYDAKQLLFVGFSDGEGAADANRAIALRRAEAVRDAVLNAAEIANLDRVDIGVDAFGEALPMACDDSEWGKQVNRRVEVWVR